MPESDPKLGIVVNYYTNFAAPDSHGVLVATTALSLRFLALNPAVNRVLLVDGSARSDEAMREKCDELGVSYYHDGQRISYVRAYNIGWQSLDEPYIGLMANDIIPHPLETVQILLDWIQRPDIGCVFPYFATNRIGGDEAQRVGFSSRGSTTCEPSTMTLNLNLFKRNILEEIDGLDENYLFGFAEPILLIKIRSLGFRAVMVGGTRSFHYDQLTKGLGESSLGHDLYLKDAERWAKEYPDYSSSRGLANLSCWRWPFATTFSMKLLWLITSWIPEWFVREKMISLVMWLEPLLTRYPARRGRAKESR